MLYISLFQKHISTSLAMHLLINAGIHPVPISIHHPSKQAGDAYAEIRDCHCLSFSTYHCSTLLCKGRIHQFQSLDIDKARFGASPPIKRSFNFACGVLDLHLSGVYEANQYN